MDTIKITVQRSDKWVQEQRLARGENVPETIDVALCPAELSCAARTILLAASYEHKYRDKGCLAYNHDYEISPWNESYGSVKFRVDSDSPTVAEVDAAIVAAAAEIATKRTECEQQRAKSAAEAEAKLRDIALRAAKLTEARELLADELAQGRATADKLALLANFLAEIPADTKRGALRKLADKTDESMVKLRKELEDASPVWILADLDD